MSDIDEVVKQLNKNPAVKVVAPDTFMQLIVENVKHE
jgi:hypothetical protein